MSIRRRVGITLAFIGVGAAGGAMTALSPLVLVRLGLTTLPRDMFSGVAPLLAAFGAPFGIVVMPVLGWLLVDRVPFWRAVALLTVGAILGTNAFALITSSLQTDVLIFGALAGGLIATLWLRISDPRVIGAR